MKKLLFLLLALFSIQVCDTIVKADMIVVPNNSLAETILKEDGLTDEHITQILTLYKSQQSSGTCSSSNVTVTEKDIMEFKSYYVTNLLNRSIGGSYSHYFKSNTGWIQRSDGITLSCHYNASAMFPKVNNGNELGANISIAFRRLKERHSSSLYWENTTSLELQFHCHALTIGQWKNPWNIEPWRTSTDWGTVIAKGCNP